MTSEPKPDTVGYRWDIIFPPDWLFRDTFRFPGEPLRYLGVNGVINLMNLSLLRMKKHE